jgi:hypothetical protein
MAYTTIDNPELYFQTKLYTGNGSTQSITLDGSENMQPDWVWIKCRSAVEGHVLFDVARGVQKAINSNTQSEEATSSNYLTAFGTDGFSVGSSGLVNANSETYASWCWKMGTAFSNDASATGVGTIDSTGSVSTTAGQSIISYSGTGSAGTIAHGLGAVPKMIMIKETSGNASGGNQSWSVYHQSTGNDHITVLNGTNAKIDDVDFNDTTPTSSVFSVGVQNRTNSGNGNGVYIAYVFSEKKGYSKFGSYEGTNSSANGAFVYTGFKPAFMMVKNIDAAKDWNIYDSARDIDNPLEKKLEPNTSDAESTDLAVDFLSNGFKFRQNGSNFNDANTYVYMAFAESPFVTSTGVPTCAR